MAYINSELGIPVSGIHQGVNFSNATGSGRGRRRFVKGLLLVGVPPVGLVYVGLSQSDKKRYKEVMGNISNPPAHLVKDYYASTKAQYPFSSNMSAEQLGDLIGKLNNEYNNWDVTRDSKAGTVARNRKALDKGANKQTIAELSAVRAWMQAINNYRAEVVKAYDKAVALEEKQASQEQTTSQQQGSYPAPKPPIGGTPVSLPPVGMDVGASLPPTTDGGTTGGATPTTDKNKKMLIYAVGGLLVVGALVYFLKK